MSYIAGRALGGGVHSTPHDMTDDWPLYPTGDGRTVYRRGQSLDPYFANIRILTPLVHGFYHYDYNDVGRLVRWPIQHAVIYEEMWRQATVLQPWLGKLRDGPNASVVSAFVFGARHCNEWHDPRKAFASDKLIAATTAASRLRGKEELKAGLKKLLVLCEQLKS